MPEQLVLPTGYVLDSATYFDGGTFEPEQDESRLTRQLARVYRLMLDGQWRTLAEIERETGDPQASVSARLRDLRKPRFGGWLVERKRVSGGLYAYRMTQPEGRAHEPRA